MPRPVPMTRALIVGPRENLEATVESLYGLKLVHIVDHREGEEGLEIGRPLPTASEASEILVKLRSIASVLQLEETPPVPTEEVASDLRQKILSLELNLSEEDAEKKKTQALLQDLNRKIDEVRPFAQLPLRLADYRGYDTLEAFVGKVAGEIVGLESVTPDYEAFSARGLLAVFAPKPQAAAIRDFPTQSFEKLESGLGRFPGLFVTELEQNHGAEHAEPAPAEADPPVLLRNPKPLRPFEMLVKLFSTPNYREIDPTFVLTFTFPIFFGLMVGDAGYGLVWMVYGIWLLRRWKDRAWDFWKNLLVTLIWGGFWSLLFGVFFFGEAFGIPFHHAALATTRVELLDWSAILGVNIPLHAPLEKLEQITDFIVLSILAAYVHLAIGFVIGLVNDLGHNRKHALGKVAWLLILTGFFVVMIVRSARWPVDAEGRTPFGYLIWNKLLGWFPREGYVYAQIGFGPNNPIPWAAIGMLLGGVGLLLATEGPLHIMEFFGLLANIVSYARLAAAGVAKGAMAFAFNGIWLETMIFPPLSSGKRGCLTPPGIA